jgi:hypothetical protein
LEELLEDATKADETILHIKDRELARLLWERSRSLSDYECSS